MAPGEAKQTQEHRADFHPLMILSNPILANYSHFLRPNTPKRNSSWPRQPSHVRLRNRRRVKEQPIVKRRRVQRSQRRGVPARRQLVIQHIERRSRRQKIDRAPRLKAPLLRSRNRQPRGAAATRLNNPSNLHVHHPAHLVKMPNLQQHAA